ncbi:DUF4177 domain-containing protein [Alteromonas sp. 5E99-2]|uniref:DUF4177 domain-containing protein n=1 Tax=Alteromonas sp. 5E99-2 TaxID=2817683 RepID=UPI001A9875DC|nr:DUF4177 domain-containing protein [Alteromonas sp. 5E99-2]MBO1254995.1 DUF4177 domain-containing protein [Alteromonas sp. 5E99-2]
MQKVIEFKKKGFWSNQVDISSLNNKIDELTKDGWIIKSLTPNTSLFGAVTSYTILIELSA